MRAVVWDSQLYVASVPEPQERLGEAIIKTTLAGICATDVEITRGYKGFQGILGHEFVGVVAACDDPWWVGRRVVGDINAACGACAACVRGDTTHCLNRTTLGIDRRDGTMAEYFSLPVANLVAVPDSIPDEAAVFAEPLAAAVEIVEQSHVRPTERLVVVGDGKLGLLVAQVLRLVGSDLMVVGRHPERWDVLRRQGIAATDDLHALDKRAWDVVVDCTGSPQGFDAATQLVRPRGRLVLKTTLHGTTTLNLSSLVVDEVTVVGSRCGPFAPSLRLMERHLIDTTAMLEQVYPLEEALAAFESSRGRLKVALAP
jgi:alcohol dehydrogenase